MPEPVSPADADAITLARDLLRTARHAALAYTDAATATPGISRVAFGLGPQNEMVTLVSALAPHVAGLRAHPDCALLVGEPGDRGDPLTHPRLMIRAQARFVPPDQRAAIRARWLADHPKSTLYVDFADFSFVTFAVRQVLLNAGFGRAHHVPPEALH